MRGDTKSLSGASKGEAEAPGASRADYLAIGEIGEHAHTSDAKYSASLRFNESL